MSTSLRAMIGILTALVFLGIGASLYTEQQPVLGIVLMALGAFRAVVAALQVRNAMLANESADSEGD